MAPPLNNTSQWRMAFVPFPWPMAHLRRSIRPYPTCPAVPFLEQYLRIAHGFRRLPVDHGPSSGEATAPPQAHGSPWQQLLARTRASARQLDAKFATSKTKLGFGICACHCNIFPWPMNNESTMPPPVHHHHGPGESAPCGKLNWAQNLPLSPVPAPGNSHPPDTYP